MGPNEEQQQAPRRPLRPNTPCPNRLSSTGPYWNWTGTIADKIHIRSLTEEQAERYQPWFYNARRYRRILTDLEEHSLRAFRYADDPAPSLPRYHPREVRNVILD